MLTQSQSHPSYTAAPHPLWSLQKPFYSRSFEHGMKTIENLYNHLRKALGRHSTQNIRFEIEENDGQDSHDYGHGLQIEEVVLGQYH